MTEPAIWAPEATISKTSWKAPDKYWTLLRSTGSCQAHMFEARRRKYVYWVLGSEETAKLTAAAPTDGIDFLKTERRTKGEQV